MNHGVDHIFQKHEDVLNGAKHAKANIDALIGYAQHVGQLLENMDLCADTLLKSNDEYVAMHAAREWGLPVSNMQYV